MAVAHNKHDYSKFFEFSDLKVGDHVRIKPTEWFERNKTVAFDCIFSVVSGDPRYENFSQGMSELCGREAIVVELTPFKDNRQIKGVIRLVGVGEEFDDSLFYFYTWHDWMLEGGPDIPRSSSQKEPCDNMH